MRFTNNWFPTSLSLLLLLFWSNYDGALSYSLHWFSIRFVQLILVAIVTSAKKWHEETWQMDFISNISDVLRGEHYCRWKWILIVKEKMHRMLWTKSLTPALTILRHSLGYLEKDVVGIGMKVRLYYQEVYIEVACKQMSVGWNFVLYCTID